MNLLLFKSNELVNGRISLADRRAEHIRDVLRAAIGDTIRVGEINGKMGFAKIEQIQVSEVILQDVRLEADPARPSLVSLIVALPRPKSLPRLLQTVSSLGVKDITFINASKVEKFFWSSDYLSEESVEKNLLLGLEQSMDTVVPKVVFERRFKPFAEDRMPSLVSGKNCLLAHPYTDCDCPFKVSEETAVAIGPEGGWVDYEIEMFKQLGFEMVKLGPRILRLENAVTALVSRLSPSV